MELTVNCRAYGQASTPKSGRLRYLPLTERLAAALAEHRHLRSKRVLCQDDGTPFTRQIVQNRMIVAAKRANVRKGDSHSPSHVLLVARDAWGARRERFRNSPAMPI
jgi:hypothetical protein